MTKLCKVLCLKRNLLMIEELGDIGGVVVLQKVFHPRAFYMNQTHDNR